MNFPHSFTCTTVSLLPGPPFFKHVYAMNNVPLSALQGSYFTLFRKMSQLRYQSLYRCGPKVKFFVIFLYGHETTFLFNSGGYIKHFLIHPHLTSLLRFIVLENNYHSCEQKMFYVCFLNSSFYIRENLKKKLLKAMINDIQTICILTKGQNYFSHFWEPYGKKNIYSRPIYLHI